jgi:hypothetical protein
LLDELAQTLAATVAEEQGILARHLSEPAQRGHRPQLGAYEAILRYYHHETMQSMSTHREALAALQHAVDVEPNNGLAWSLQTSRRKGLAGSDPTASPADRL